MRRNKTETTWFIQFRVTLQAPKPPGDGPRPLLQPHLSPPSPASPAAPSITGMVPESTLPNTTCCRDKLPEEIHLRCCPKASAPNQHCTVPFPQRPSPSKTQVKGTRVRLTFSRGPEPALNPRVPSASTSPERLEVAGLYFSVLIH